MTVPLKYRIAAVILLLEAVMMGTVLWVTLNHAVESAVRQIEAAEQVTLNIISNIARVSLLNEDYDYIQGHIEALPDNPGILQAVLADENGTIVASSKLTNLGSVLPELANEPDKHWNVVPVQNAAGQLGTLAVQFSTAEKHAIYRKALNRGILIAAIGMTIIAIFSIGFGHLLTRRLNTVVNTANQVSDGNYNVRTGFRRDDEVGRVGKAFDTMADVIAAEKRSLSRTNDELEQRVEERTSKLQEAKSEYEAFAYAVSHDLRAPLRSMNGFADILLEDYSDRLNKDATDYLQRIKNASLKMSQLIDDLLTLSRVNRAEIQSQPVNLSDICREVVDELREQMPEHKVQVDIEPDMLTQGDPQLLRDALMNLIGNAWKFTGKTDNPQIRISTEQLDGHTVYKVEDNGAGFDEAYIDKLFVPFQRLHSDRDFPGTGIGLSTVLRVIKRHNGTIRAESADTGAVFRFTLGDT